MRVVIAVLAFALLTASAQAQGGTGLGSGSHGKHGRQQADKGEAQKPKIDDKAYNASLRNIPDKKYDAWHGVR
jgi:hypothetical protein